MNKCNLITDLLPLYAEDLLSEDSKQLVERHLAKCAACSEKLKLLKTPAAPSPRAESAPEEEVLKKTRKKIKKHTAAVAAASVCLSLIVVACAVFFPIRLKEVRDILYPYGINGKPDDVEGAWTYATDSMIKLGKPIETYTQEPPEEGYPFSQPHGPDKEPLFTLILPEPYTNLVLNSAYAVRIENTGILVRKWNISVAFHRAFDIWPDNISDKGNPEFAPVARYCKKHSLTTWLQIVDYAVTYRKSEFSLLFSPNSAALFTAYIFRARDNIVNGWVQKGETYCPQVYHPFRGAFEGYAFSHEGAAGNWTVCVTTEQHVYEIFIGTWGEENVLFPDEESIADLLSTATFV